MKKIEPLSLYVHVPFCSRKCIYCDFFSVGEKLADWPRYVDSLLAEAGERVRAASSYHSTIYIGGGTPSLMPADEFERLAQGLLEFAGHTPAEFTIEVNPDDVTPDKARSWRRAGVNRVSMGVQSLDDAELQMIGRRHDSASAVRAFSILREEFDNVSLDLMFGLPGQSVASLEKSIEGMLAMYPEHISAYSLMYEERTALTRMRDSGKIEEASEDVSVEMFRLISERLASAGYEQYEISNYARPGRRAVHNSRYWRGLPYVGLGPGAHSYDGMALRRHNLPDIRAYLAGNAVYEEENLSSDELREEMIMTRLRTREGLRISVFRGKFGDEALESLRRAASSFLKSGLLIQSEDSLRLSREGIMVSDEVIAALF